MHTDSYYEECLKAEENGLDYFSNADTNEVRCRLAVGGEGSGRWKPKRHKQSLAIPKM
jgi:hypothetical protein